MRKTKAMTTKRATLYLDDCYKVTVVLSNDIDEYAKDFLALFNNVREWDYLLKIENNPINNEVDIYCTLETVHTVEKALENYGVVYTPKKCLYAVVENIDYDLNKYDSLIVIDEQAY